jgi:hypothetical protein
MIKKQTAEKTARMLMILPIRTVEQLREAS